MTPPVPPTPPPGCSDRCRLSPSFPSRCKCECKGTWHGSECPEADRHKPRPRRSRAAAERKARRRQVVMSFDRRRSPAEAPPDPMQLGLFDGPQVAE